MCGRITQLSIRQRYAQAIGEGIESNYQRWVGGDRIPQYNIGPGTAPRILHRLAGRLDIDDVRWGYRTPKEAAEKRKPWINARIEKALTGHYFRHMFRDGRVIVPAEGWYEWTVENGKKQPWFITRTSDEPIFMAALTNWRPFRPLGERQTVETGVVIVTADAEGGMIDVHDRRPVALNPHDARRWLDPETPVEEAALLARTRSLPTEEFIWWKVDRTVNVVDPNKNNKSLLTPI